MSERCRYCDTLLEESLTTFTVAKETIVYVVRAVPGLQCPRCGEVIFSQETAEKLSRYVSGKIMPLRRPLSAQVFQWGDPIEEVDGWASISQTGIKVIVAPVGTAPIPSYA